MIMLVAMLTMLIDHIGAVFFPDQEWLRVIGRIAFPLYAFGIVQGYRHTSNLKRYFMRLLFLAIISQIPYVVLFETTQLNVIFLFLIALLWLYLLDNFKKREALPFIICFTILISPFIEYGIYGIALVFIYRYFSGKNIVMAHLGLSGIYLLLFQEDFYIQYCAILASVLILYKEKLLSYPIKINRQLYRVFYPGHLAILAVLSVVIG